MIREPEDGGFQDVIYSGKYDWKIVGNDKSISYEIPIILELLHTLYAALPLYSWEHIYVAKK